MSTVANPARGDAEVWKTSGLLIAIILHNLIYPISQQGLAGAVIFYLFYGSMFIVATWLLSDDRRFRLAALLTGLAVIAAGIAYAVIGSKTAALPVFVASIAYHLVIIAVLIRYIFGSDQVFTEVILAATSLYLILGSAFAAIFATIEWLQPGSFAGANGPVQDWQQLLYFSYVTITSLGYGDILPVGIYAQAFVSFEAITGVLYTVILLSRLVGMYAAKR